MRFSSARFSWGLFALAITLGLAMSSVAKAEDSDTTGPKSHPFPKRIYQGGSCYNFGYAWPGISLTIFDDHPRKPVRAWICMHEFTLVPHDWPWHYP